MAFRRATVLVRVEIDRAAVVREVGPQIDVAVHRAALKSVERVRTNIRRKGRVDTGGMVRSIRQRQTRNQKLRPAREVYSTSKHFRYQNEGTRGSTARPGGWLVFKPKGSGVFVFAKKTRPITPGYFIRDAQRAIRPSDFEK